ncbi:hypothetical protein TNCV_565821 [Trichonephila clavipes]|nr:hypothetical protein TNCV_565821 [Trichonephila clavipes]
MTARPNCDYLVSIEWMRYQRQWVPYRIFFARQCEKSEAFPFPPGRGRKLGSKRHCASAPCEELEQFIKVHLVKDYLERENHGWDLVIGATDLATYMYLDQIIPEVMQYVGGEHQAETAVHDMIKLYRSREEDSTNV